MTEEEITVHMILQATHERISDLQGSLIITWECTQLACMPGFAPGLCLHTFLVFVRVNKVWSNPGHFNPGRTQVSLCRVNRALDIWKQFE